MTYTSTKHFNHEVGLSCCFRQWRASSHCRFLHGYALAVTLDFAATELDKNGWVQDFGGLKDVKQFLVEAFDHKTMVAHDDPDIAHFDNLNKKGIIQMRLVQGTGCEAFARMIGENVQMVLRAAAQPQRVTLTRCTVAEHGSNSASWIPA